MHFQGRRRLFRKIIRNTLCAAGGGGDLPSLRYSREKIARLFPWFYDKAYWKKYLDFLVAHRMNALCIWNGHPFASLVRVPDYPYAVEVPDDVPAKNRETFRHIVEEADQRGIMVMQMFYHIIVSRPFAQRNHFPSTQFAAPTPLPADYTRKSIAEFVKTYPHAGLRVCLGEAQRRQHVSWMVDTIIGGIRDDMKQAGLTRDIPLMLRTHAMPAEEVIPQVIKFYPMLYPESKYNGESLTTWQPRGSRSKDGLGRRERNDRRQRPSTEGEAAPLPLLVAADARGQSAAHPV